MPPELETKPKTTDNPTDKPAEAAKPKASEQPGATASAFLDRMAGGLKKKPDPEKKAPEKKPEAEPESKKPEEKPKEQPPKAKEEPKFKVEPMTPPPLDAEAIAEAAARGVASTLKPKETEPEKKGKTEDPALAVLTEDERETFEVLTRMEKDYGSRYANHSKQYVQALAKEKAYRARWESEHPGLEFDPESSEHDKFFADNDVDWNDTHFNRTLAKIEAEKIAERERAKGNKELEELRRKEKIRDAEPKLTAKVRETAKSFFSALGEAYKDVISAEGKINLAEIKRLTDEDPLKSIVFESADSVEAFSGELFRLSTGLADWDDKNPSHQFIDKFYQEQEILLKSLPSEQQLNQKGQRFATMEEWQGMSPSKRAYFWTLSPDELTAMYAAREAVGAQSRIAAEEKRIEDLASKRGFIKKEAPKEAPNSNAAANAAAAAAAVEKPKSPSGTVEPRLAPPPIQRGPDGQSKATSFTERWLGSR